MRQHNISGWKPFVLGNCLEKNPEYGLNAPSTEFSPSLPTYIRITDFTEEGKLIKEGLTSVSHSDSSQYFLDEDDIVFARTGASVGKTYLYNELDGKLVYAGFLIRVKTKKNILQPKFLYYFTKTHKYWNWILIISSRSGQPGINSQEIKSLKFNAPTTDEQNRIVAVLETWEKTIDKLEKKIEIKKKIKNGLMQQLLTGDIRLFGFNNKWQTIPLGKICIINPSCKTLPKSFIYIDLESVEKGLLKRERKIMLEGAPSRAQRLLEKHDILFQMVRPYQKNNLYFDKEGEYVASTGYAQIRAIDSSRYLYYVLHTDAFVNKVLERCTGSNYPAINSSDLSKIYISIPDKKEQIAIADILTAADKELNKLYLLLSFMKDQKKYLLNNLITGTIRTPENLRIN